MSEPNEHQDDKRVALLQQQWEKCKVEKSYTRQLEQGPNDRFVKALEQFGSGDVNVAPFADAEELFRESLRLAIESILHLDTLGQRLRVTCNFRHRKLLQI